MTAWQALLLGIVQGVTEFLPISSSGHLVILQQVLNVQGDIFTFDIILHLATLGAIIIFFGFSLLKVTRREWFMIGVATIPAVLVGVLLKDLVESLFAHNTWVGIELMVTGLINFYIAYLLKKDTQLTEAEPTNTSLTVAKSFGIGIAQAIAIIPGISRSGSTVAGALKMGLSRAEAFRFSFLLAIPALLGAGILEIPDVMKANPTSLPLVPILIGSLAAFVSGILSLRLFKYVIMHAQLQWFGWYCLVVGAIAFVILR